MPARFYPLDRALHGLPCHLHDVHADDRHCKGIWFEPVSTAGVACSLRHELLNLAAHVVGIGLPISPLKVADDTFYSRVPRICVAALRNVGYAHLPSARPVKEQLDIVDVHFANRHVHRHIKMLLKRSDSSLCHLRIGVVSPPRCQRAICDGQRLVGYHKVRIDLHAESQSCAIRTRAIGSVE